MQIKNNKLFLGGISAEKLIEEYGSPLYAYEGDLIRQRARELKKAISFPRLRINFACKANTNIAIMKLLREEGCCIDAVSPEEVFLALQAGYSPSQILFTGNNVTNEEMRFLIDNRILINIDSLSQLERYGKIHPSSKISIRINPDVGAGHHEHTITGGPDSKFGIYFNKVNEIKKIAEKYKLRVIGIHMHIGSGILKAQPYYKAIEALLKAAKEFDSLEFVDIGGGLGVPYKEEEKELNIKEFGRNITGIFNDFSKDYGRKISLILEPGRYLAAEAGYLLTKVNTLKSTPKRKFIGVNTGFNHLIRHAMYGSYHKIINASRVTGPKEKADVAGNLCESGDLFCRDRAITKVEEGDVLAILNAGAYGFSMSSNYNSRLKPAEVLVSKGKAKIIRKREVFDDLVRGQVV